jgi:WD40 repeat protein/serine/threonine protein kinase
MIVSDKGGENTGNYVLLTRLADEFAARFRGGEQPSLQEYIDRFPELADDIRELFPGMIEIEQAKKDHRDGDAAVPSALPMRQLGDFRIIQEIGRGGMGVVYEAEQVSLGRHVALKVLPKQLLVDPRTKQRFEREAKAAAKLHHTNIVPVFGVGEHEGVPYYVMQFIRGTGLNVVIKELARMGPDFQTPGSPRPAAHGTAAAIAHSLATDAYQPASADDAVTVTNVNIAASQPGTAAPRSEASGVYSSLSLPGQSDPSSTSAGRRLSYWHSVARVGVQVAEALAYAHKQGIVHRDVKPANLLLDMAGTVWVTDFGLAKADDQEDLTHTGDVLGTLRYMPPEAFEGKSDARGDVYSLGLTLYELVAQRPTFSEKDRPKLIKLVTTGEVTPVGRVRKGVPRDLETIIHKAIEREPERRYQKAEDLAEDLRLFLADRTIKARRATVWEQTRRWARRNPAVAGLLGVVAVLLISVSIASIVVALRMTQLATSEETARRAADEDRQKAVETGDRERWERYRANLAAASAALQLHRSGTAQRALDAAPEQHRNWEWKYFHNQLDGASRVLPIPDWGRDYLDHPIIAVIPDGRQIATASKNFTVSLWDANSAAGQPAYVLRGHTGQVTHLVYSPDGRQLASGSQDSIRLWDPATGQPSFVLPGEGTPALAFSPDSKRLISTCDVGKSRLWDATTGKLIAIIGESRPALRYSIATFSPDGKRVVAAAGKEVRIYETSTGRQLSSLGPHDWLVGGVYFSPDGKRICTSRNERAAGPDTAYLWNAETGNLVAKLIDHRSLITQVAFNSASTRLATACLYPENLVRLWDATSGELLRELPGHANSLYDLSFSPDGTRLASASMDQTARLWDTNTGAEIAVLRGHWSTVDRATFSQDGKRIFTSSHDHTIRLWDAKNGELVAVLRGHTGAAWVHFTRDGLRLISTSDDGTVRFWDLNLLERSGVLRGHTSFVYDVAFSPNGEQVASAGWDGTARLWDATAGSETFKLEHPKPYVTSLAYSRDGRTLATGNTGYGAVLWDLATRRPHLAVPLTPYMTHVSLSPDGGILACDAVERGLVVLYDAKERKQLAELTYNEDDPEAPVNRGGGDPLFSPDGATLVTNSTGGKVVLWDVASWKVRDSLPEYTGWAYRFAFSPDSQLLALGGRFNSTLTLCLFDLRNRAQLARLNLGSQVLGLAFSPDGTRLAVGCRDNTIRLIDVATRQEVAELRGHTDYVQAVAWSPDGTKLVSGSGDKTVRIWDSLSVKERAERK